MVTRLRVLILGAVLGAALMAGSAQAEVLHLGRHFLGVTPHRGVSPRSLPGAMAAMALPSATSSSQLTWQGGPVVHSSAPYLIFWTPSGENLPSGTASLLTRYFTDVATASGTAANVYGVARQYYDATGVADYRQTFSSSQAITDTNAYPSGSSNCTGTTTTYRTCITDTQLETEIQRVITADHLPADGPGNESSLPANAPIYFVVLPADVNLCTTYGATTSCADSAFCAYHSAFTANNANVLYAAIPTLILGTGQNPKECQWDGTQAIQEPNRTAADVVAKYVSHEDNETLTDPFGTAWYDMSSGNENGDDCNSYGSPNPAGGTSPNAFAPALGGSSSGTLYNQLIAGDQYYLQSEWSNGDNGCDLRPAAGTVTPSFAAPAAALPGTAISFDPSTSNSTASLSSATWNFGDGATAFSYQGQTLTAPSHTYAADGSYTVTLTLVDVLGNAATVSHTVHVDDAPTASFRVVTASPGSGQPTQFDATASSDSDGTIPSYSWDFGDGSTGTGATPSHPYQAAKSYTVTLTVTDSSGQSATTSQTVSVAGPTPAFSASAATENAPASFDASASTDTPSSAHITSYTWNFGDTQTHTDTAATTTHTYAQYGTYQVTLTETDSVGRTSSSVSQLVVADESPTVSITPPAADLGAGQATSFAASANDPDGSISAYAWDFGDGKTGSSATPSHTYTAPGTYTVTVTVTDSAGDTALASQRVTVVGPAAAFTAPAPALEGTTLTFTAAAPGTQGVGSITYDWNFGDGSADATSTSTTHAYATAGIYTVTLTEKDASGDISTVSHTVTALDEAPSAAFSISSPLASTRTPATFDATGSADPDGTVTVYNWNFGDGTTGSGAAPVHQYTAAGVYTVTLSVTDSDGQTSAPVSHAVTVYAPPAAAFAVAGNGATEHQPMSFNASTSSDIGPGGPITGYQWSFGDGATATGLTAAHAFSAPGSYPVTLTVTNSVGLTSTVTQWVTVGDEAPSVGLTLLTAHPTIGHPVSFDGASSADPDGHIVAYDWTFGDGTSAGTSRPQHTYRAAGRYTVALTVIGSGGERATATTTVTVAPISRITAARVAAGLHPMIVISVSGPGTVRIANHRITLRAAGQARAPLALTRKQRRALAAGRTLHLVVNIRFTPLVGAVQHQRVLITVHPGPVRRRHYTVALRP